MRCLLLPETDFLIDSVLRLGPGSTISATIVGELCQKWALEPLAPSTREERAPSSNACPTVDGTRYALKLSPEPAISGQEAAALTYWADGPSVVDLVDADATRGAVLLEWLPNATELTADKWGIAELTGLISGPLLAAQDTAT